MKNFKICELNFYAGHADSLKVLTQLCSHNLQNENFLSPLTYKAKHCGQGFSSHLQSRASLYISQNSDHTHH